MKQLQLSKPLLLITVGLPGAGKSVFAGNFSKTYGCSWVHGNRIRHILTPRPSYVAEENRVVDELIGYQLLELLRTRHHIVLDTQPSTQLSYVEVSQKAQEMGYQVLFVWLQIDPVTAKMRSLKPSNRPPHDRYNAGITSAVYEQGTRLAQTPSAKDAYVVVSGKHPFASQMQAVLHKISELDSSKPTPKVMRGIQPASPTLAAQKPTPAVQRSRIRRATIRIDDDSRPLKIRD